MGWLYDQQLTDQWTVCRICAARNASRRTTNTAYLRVTPMDWMVDFMDMFFLKWMIWGWITRNKRWPNKETTDLTLFNIVQHCSMSVMCLCTGRTLTCCTYWKNIGAKETNSPRLSGIHADFWPRPGVPRAPLSQGDGFSNFMWHGSLEALNDLAKAVDDTWHGNFDMSLTTLEGT